MNPVHLNQCPHLLRALNYATEGGACFIRSHALMLDLPEATLVYGVVRGATLAESVRIGARASPVPFIHAWVEHKGQVYAPTLIETLGGLVGIHPRTYYATNGVTRTWRMENPAFLAVANQYGFGKALRTGKGRAGKGDFVRLLFDAAGVEYRMSERGTALPL